MLKGITKPDQSITRFNGALNQKLRFCNSKISLTIKSTPFSIVNWKNINSIFFT